MFTATILNCTMLLQLQGPGTEIQELNLPGSLRFRGPKCKVTTSTVNLRHMMPTVNSGHTILKDWSFSSLQRISQLMIKIKQSC